MIPIKDENPSSTTPFVNYGLIIVNVVAFLLTYFSPNFDQIVTIYGVTPAQALNGGERIAFITSMLTGMFLHGGLLHIGGNMLYLYIFGDNVEDLLGHIGYILFYIPVGIAGSLVYIASNPSGPVAIGASGAISGVLAAYVVHFPSARVRAIVYYGFFARLTRVPALILIGFWFVYQLVFAFLDVEGGVAYFAHIGGFLAGLLTGFLIPRRREPASSDYLRM
ncbi:rhomboid family intramembrane serine protease [Candidatus Bathyarchaeota archaeon]|nr:MAG: rhomboid family intramembrane serine protease [Candidatus Bathyarchaeota archaeon]TMI32166.1 MAG: rhomboid family intramembrane serine protease [Candidatus Bathyarchaeota archaeon]